MGNSTDTLEYRYVVELEVGGNELLLSLLLLIDQNKGIQSY